MKTVITEGGTPVWDSFDDWIKLVESIGGYVCSVELYRDDIQTRAKKTPWTTQEIADFQSEVKEDNGLDPDEPHNFKSVYITGE